MKKFTSKYIIQTLLFCLFSAQICFAQGYWSKIGDMPEIRYGHTVNELNGKIYVVGGINTETSAFPKTVLVYDISLQEWSAIPLARNKIRDMHCSCVVDGNLYVMAGNDSLHTVATMDMFDPETEEWISKAPLSIDRGLSACVVIDDKIYVMGGIQVLGNVLDLTANYFKWEGTNRLEVYDTKNDTWTTLADMPTKRWGHTATAFNGKIYLFGGTSAIGGLYSSVDIYDPMTNTWDTKSTLPKARYCLTSCLLDSHIYVIGGWAHSSGGPIYDKVEVYNPQTNEWKTENPIPVPTAGAVPLIVDGKIRVYGGTLTTHPNIGTSAIYELTFDDIVSQQPYLDKSFAVKNTDSILFLTRFTNIYNHTFTANLICVNSEGIHTDSLFLFDDGQHGDSLANDGLFGAYIPPCPTEDFFKISVQTNDNQTNKYFITPDRCRYTTVGPVVLDSIAFRKSSSFYAVKFFVKNNSETTTIKKPSIKIICDDPWALPILSNTKSGRDIKPGGVEWFGNTFLINFIDSIFPGYFNLKVEIGSDGYFYWTDSVQLKVATTGVETELQETTTNLEQNYPNPFSKVTTIKYTVPVASKVLIRIYDFIGKEIECLVNEEKPTGTYEVTWHAGNLPGGIYFYQLNAGSVIETKKMIFER